MKKMLCLLLPFLLLTASIAIAGKEFWEDKEFKDWSQKDCTKLLTDSPWSQKMELATVKVMDDSRTSTDGQQPYIRYRIQFRSALPIRQAIVRQGQIASKYESLSAEQKQEFDKQSAALLDGFPADSVVVNISYEANDNSRSQELARYWQSQSTELLKTQTYLTCGKTKVPLARYIAAQGGNRSFQFIFPREVDGKPILNPQDKSIKLEFTYPTTGVLDGFGSGNGFQEFKTAKMIFAGNIAF